ncbi:type I methionyl aminopeptidase [Candidatus Gracilibacteria bacterium]|nr:type I methionyl aminopeptidase [Candidatus Gracilibacteria bacterium]
MTKISIRTPEQLALMRHSGKILQKAQKAMKKACVAGTTLLELDAIAEHVIRSEGATPAFKGFQGFPNTICSMINSEVVHGIPDNRKLQNGDMVSIDCGCFWKGWCADAAFTIIIGGDEQNPERAKFSASVKKALEARMSGRQRGNTLGDIGYIIEKTIVDAGYSICEEYTGHGLGREMHEAPYVYNYGMPGKGLLLKSGMTFAIEPIVASGNPKVKTLKDGWTVVTEDGRDACQWEHFGVVTPDGLEIFA